ncbi:MAG: hypothetical protein RLO12_11025 [Fulvivirga sp.]
MRILIVGLGTIAKKHLKTIFFIDPQAKVFVLRHDEKAAKENGG